MSISKNYRPRIDPWKEGNDYWRFAHHKLDGIYCQVRITERYGTIGPDLYSKLGNQINCEDAISDCPVWGWAGDISPGYILLGELYVPNQPASCVKSEIANYTGKLRWACYAIVETPGKDIFYWAKQDLHAVQVVCERYGIPMVPFTDYNSLNRPHPSDITPPELEGVMLKESNLVGWYRYKRKKTIDCIITKVNYGEGKYHGMIGSFTVATYEGCEIAHVSGMTDKVRATSPSEWIGKVIEVEYQQVLSRGRLRHPVFLRVRDDKLPEQCLLTQDDELSKHWNK